MNNLKDIYIENLQPVNLENKKCIVRVDFNVPLSDENELLDDTRIKTVKKTIDFLISKKAKVILISHMGRPKGKPDPNLSLGKIIDSIELILKYKIHLIDINQSDEFIHNSISDIKSNQIIMFENIRFNPEEESYSDKFSKYLSSFGDIYINEAFAVSHRNHSSITGIPKFIPGFMGYMMYKEFISISNQSSQLSNNSICIFGGAKISDKIQILNNFLGKVECIAIGGGMIKEFAHYLNSKNVSLKKNNIIHEILNNNKTKILIPKDVMINNENLKPKYIIKNLNEVLTEDNIVDIGPKTIEFYSNSIKNCSYILWNGPMGIFENPDSNKGTSAIAKSIAENNKAYSVAGGGSTVQAINQFISKNKISHVSTGGGAFMEYIENGTLPGINAIIQNKN
jgi:phosphoglycerate kinase